jgi:hypothetical protein
LLGVYDFVENVTDQEAPIWQNFLPQTAAKTRGAGMLMVEPSLGMDIQHSKTIHVNVEVWYRVSAF